MDQKARTICFPESLVEKSDEAYDKLLEIDCNFSRLLQNLLDSIIAVAKIVLKQKKNFRHFRWEIIIQDKETKIWFSRYGLGLNREKKK